MCTLEILEPIRDHFASNPLGPTLSFPRFCDDPPEKLRDVLSHQLEIVPSGIVACVLEDQSFLSHNNDRTDLDREARIWAVARALGKELSQHRLRAVQQGSEELRSLDALSDLDFDDEGLLPMAEFHGFGGALLRRGYAFSIMPMVESENSPYWLVLALRRTGSWESAKIRLDPFMWGPQEEFPQMNYRMWSWGERLSWTDLVERSKDEYGEWIPSKLSQRSLNTQYVWVDRRHESHLQMEELPLQDSIAERGSRYCHAIYDKNKSAVIHLDGAIRILGKEEWDQRSSKHLKDVGKVGKRLKIFRIDEPIDTHTMSMLCMNFFIWNYDVARFFGADIPSDI